jgi:hypothetical protein
MRKRLLILLLPASLAASSRAFAEPSETDRNLAQSLFEQAKKLMKSGKYAEACPKLAESQRLDPGGGTLLNLGLCHEKEGKVASAWTDFKGALSDAKRDARQDRVEAAEQHIAALEPKLPWLTVSLAKAPSDASVKLDGVSVGSAAWGSPMAVDPGSHELSVSAPKHETYTQAFTVALAQKLTLEVPALSASASPDEAAPPAEATNAGAPPEQPRPEPEGHGHNHTAAWVVGASGLVAIGVGSYFGVHALSKRNESSKHCPTDSTCSDEGVTLNQQAYTSAWISNIAIGLGVVGIGVSTYLFLKDGGESGRAQGLSLGLDAGLMPGGAGLRVHGAL